MPDQTIRQRIEQIRDEVDAYLRQTLTDSAYNPAVGMCERIRVAADDTLADLNNAERRFQGHDPENGGDVVYRLIPDPDSRGAA